MSLQTDRLPIDDKTMNRAIENYWDLGGKAKSPEMIDACMHGWGLGKKEISGYSAVYQETIKSWDAATERDLSKSTTEEATKHRENVTNLRAATEKFAASLDKKINTEEQDNRTKFERYMSEINFLQCGHTSSEFKKMRTGETYSICGMENSALTEAWGIWQVATA